ncbi:hypothetical protein ACFQV2_34025 [Actinokineospora soli]|uniref:DUF3558 domain-containing protein n=1 Tax=Actinokineospora soli TaxID=1048753 RepID=A0ABW2TWT6_9PSEU
MRRAENSDRRFGVLDRGLFWGSSAGEAPTVTQTFSRSSLPTVANPVDVPADADVCGMVDAGLLGDLGVTGDGQSRPGSCLWQTSDGTRLAVGLRVGRDPLLDIVGAGAPDVRLVELHGFPAMHSGAKGRAMCDVYVKTGAEQGFSVAYGKAQRTDDDLCAPAISVAEQVAEGLRG